MDSQAPPWDPVVSPLRVKQKYSVAGAGTQFYFPFKKADMDGKEVLVMRHQTRLSPNKAYCEGALVSRPTLTWTPPKPEPPSLSLNSPRAVISMTMMVTCGATLVGTFHECLGKFRLAAFMAFLHALVTAPVIFSTFAAYEDSAYALGGSQYDLWSTSQVSVSPG